MADPPQLATTRRAVRAARLDQELDRSAPLREGERVLAAGVLRSGVSAPYQRLSYVRVSNWRICLVQHCVFRPDVLVEIPRTALTSVTRLQGPWVQLAVEHETGLMTIRLRPWEKRLGRLVVEPKLALTPDDLCSLLNDTSPE